MRLARFNIQTAAATDKRYFVGMPSPAAAGVIASTIFLFPDGPLTPLQDDRVIGERGTCGGKAGRAARHSLEVVTGQRAPEVEQWRDDLDYFEGRIAALEGRRVLTARSTPPAAPTMASAAGSLHAVAQDGLPAPDALGLTPKL